MIPNQKYITLLDQIHSIIDEGDNSASHDMVELMFHLLDPNALETLQHQISRIDKCKQSHLHLMNYMLLVSITHGGY